jgi:hypothetical protein
MALVRNTTVTREIPHEPGNFVTIRRVRRQLLREAAEKRQQDALMRVQRLGGATALRELKEAATQAVKEADAEKLVEDTKPKRATAASYDEALLLKAGVVALNGPLYVDEETGDPIGDKVGDDVLDALDDPTATYIADEIAAFADKGAQEKND